MKPRLFALALVMLGGSMLGGLLYAWSVPYEAVVFTIFPMMGTPYIIAVACVCLGLEGLFEGLGRAVWSWVKGWGST